MNARRMMVMAVIALMLMASIVPVSSVDAEQKMTAKASYFDEIVSVWGTVPDGYDSDRSHLDIVVYDVGGQVKAKAFAIPSDDGTYHQDIRCVLQQGKCEVSVRLMGVGLTNVLKELDLVVDSGSIPVPVDSISVTSSLTMNVGDAHRLVCKFNPENASYKSLEWSSSDEAVATVDATGNVRAISSGHAVIKAETINGKKSTCDLTVRSVLTPSVDEVLSLSASSYSIYTGGTDSISIVATVPSGISNSSLVWSVDDRSIADFVDTTVGKKTVGLYGKSPGIVKVTLSIKGSNQETSINISVNERIATVSSYTFYLKMDVDADQAQLSGTRFTSLNLMSGITLTGYGANAGEALESALEKEGISHEFFSGGDILYWVDQIFGMEQVHYSNGDWKYWIQYHNGSYNQWTLGHYTDGGSFELIYGITDENGQTVDPRVHEDDPGTPVDPGSGDTPNPQPIDNPDGSKTETVENPDGSTTETTTSADGKTTTVVETDADGNKTTTKTVKNDDGSQTETVTNSDGSTQVTNTDKPVVTTENGTTTTETSSSTVNKDAEGNTTGYVDTTTTVIDNKDSSEESIKTETVKDADGNVTGSTEVSETKDADGNVTGTSSIVKDADGNEVSYEKTETVPETTTIDSDGNTVTESAKTVTERDSSGTVRTEESVKTTVKDNGEVEKETVKDIQTTDANGNTSSVKVTDRIVEDDLSTMTAVTTETKDASGKESVEKVIEAESKDGDIRTVSEVPSDSDKAQIVTTVQSESSGDGFMLSAEKIEQAIAIQEKVASEVSKDVSGQEKVIQVETEEKDVSLTVSKEAVKAVSDSGSELKVVSDTGTMSLSKEVLSNLSDEDEITVSMSSVEMHDLNDSQKGSVPEGSTIVDLKVLSGADSVGDRLGGTVTMTIKHPLVKGTIAVAYYIAEDGTKEKLNGTYDSENEVMSVETTHCSIYAVVNELPEEEPVTPVEPEPVVNDGSSDDNTMLYIGIAVAVIAVIAIGAVVYMRKN